MSFLEGTIVLADRDPRLALAQDAARVRLGEAHLWIDTITCGGTLKPPPDDPEIKLALEAFFDAIAVGEEWGVIGRAGTV